MYKDSRFKYKGVLKMGICTVLVTQTGWHEGFPREPKPDVCIFQGLGNSKKE